MNEIIDKPNQIRAYHIASQISAIKLEGKGLRFRGGSILAHCKRSYGLKGNRESIIEQLTKMKEYALASS